MQGKKYGSHPLIFLGEFTDKQLEKEYMEQGMREIPKFLRPVLLVLGIIYLLFFLPDFFIIKSTGTLVFILLCRFLPLLVNMLLYFKLQKYIEYQSYKRWVTAYELIVVVSFSTIFYLYESPDFMAQVLTMMVIILGLFMIPNRWLYVICISIVFSTSFFVLAVFHFKTLPPSRFYAAIVFTLLALVLSGIFSHIINYFKRADYARGKELSRMSITDPLTGIYNRIKFDEELKRWIKLSRENKADFSLAIFDFDDFKTINDHFGHLTGDRVIIDTISLVKSELRDTDVFARWGGEEFVILFPVTNRSHAVEIAERIRSRVENYSFPHIGGITVSFGVVSFYEDDDINSLVQRADQLLYIAKETGKNKVLS